MLHARPVRNMYNYLSNITQVLRDIQMLSWFGRTGGIRDLPVYSIPFSEVGTLHFSFLRVSDPHFFFADPDPDPGGIRGRGLGVKGKMNFFLSFFHVSDDS